MTASTLHSHADILFGMLGEPVLRRKGWEAFRRDTENLATIMENYSLYLDKVAELAKNRASRDHAVRPLDKFSDIEIRPRFDGASVLTKEELLLQQAVDDAGEWQPVEISSANILDENTTAMQRRRFLKGLKENCTPKS